MASIVITDAGAQLLADLIANVRTATFTEMQLSSHDYSDVSLTSLTSLADVEQAVSFSSVSVIDATTVKLTAVAENTKVATTFYVNTIGLVAVDNNNISVLYAVIDTTAEHDAQPAYDGSNVTRLSYTFNVHVGATSSVIVNVTAVTSADQISYDNTQSKLSTTNVKSAIDELADSNTAIKSDVDDLGVNVTTIKTELDKKANVTDLTSHTSNTSNPHSVTAEQVGLGNVDNTADADKPVSTATQTALDAKLDTTVFDNYKVAAGAAIDAKLNLKVSKSAFTTEDDKVKTLNIDGTTYEFAGGLTPQIIVTITEGSSVVCTNGTWQETQVVTETGKVTFTVPSYGDYTLTATLATKSTTTAVSVTECKQYEIAIQYYVTMTAKIDLSNSNPATCVTYADDAVNMTAGSSEWDDFFGHYPCLLKDGVEVGKLNPNNFAKFEDGSTADITSGSAGDVMIAFPRRGLKISKSGSIVTISMTDNPNDANFDYNAHTRGTTAKDVFYLGAYKGYTMDSKLRSLSGKTPTVKQNISTFRTQAQANGAGYEQSAFYQLTYRQAMYILKYKNLNSQSAVGMGYTGGSAATSTGNTNTSGMDYGTTSSTQQVKLFGLEDFWGNIYEWIDGLFCNSSYHILTGSDGFNDTGSGYTDNGAYTSLTVGGYMTNVTGDSNTGLNITAAGGSSSTYFADYADLYAGCLPGFGGVWSDGARAGAFYLVVDCSASNANSALGARLMFL